MCGNGIRCVAKYIYDNKIVEKRRLTIETLSGLKTVEIHAGIDGLTDIRQNGNDSVGAHTRMMAAHFNSQPGKVVERTFHAVDICEIVAQPPRKYMPASMGSRIW